jgi:exodeoxyribonuclease III
MMAHQNINVVSLNVRGLSSSSKRRALFGWLNDKGYQIVCLQETHCTVNSLENVKKDWNGLSFHCLSQSNHSKGVSILFSPKFKPKIGKVCYDDDARKMIVCYEYCGQAYSVINLYAPTEQSYRKHFYAQCTTWIKNRVQNNNCVLLCGDMNCSLENIDRKVPNYDSSRESFKRFISQLDLVDTYRHLNTRKTCYTYSNSTCKIQSRIDYVFCSKYMAQLAKKSYTQYPPKVPDHRAVITSFRPDITHGKGYWKLNTSVLNDEQYREQVCDIISSTKNDYGECLNKRDLWDFCKLRIKEFSIKYTSLLSQIKRYEIQQVEKQICDIEKSLNATMNDEERKKLVKQQNDIKLNIDMHYLNRSKGAQVRARAQWVEDGEKNTKYFLALEQKHQTNNTIISVKNANGHNVYTNDKILDTAANFYETLYSPTNINIHDIDQYLNAINGINTQDEDESQQCEGQVTIVECENVITNMADGKSPGLMVCLLSSINVFGMK